MQASTLAILGSEATRHRIKNFWARFPVQTPAGRLDLALLGFTADALTSQGNGTEKQFTEPGSSLVQLFRHYRTPLESPTPLQIAQLTLTEAMETASRRRLCFLSELTPAFLV